MSSGPPSPLANCRISQVGKRDSTMPVAPCHSRVAAAVRATASGRCHASPLRSPGRRESPRRWPVRIAGMNEAEFKLKTTFIAASEGVPSVPMTSFTKKMKAKISRNQFTQLGTRTFTSARTRSRSSGWGGVSGLS